MAPELLTGLISLATLVMGALGKAGWDRWGKSAKKVDAYGEMDAELERLYLKLTTVRSKFQGKIDALETEIRELRAKLEHYEENCNC